MTRQNGLNAVAVIGICWSLVGGLGFVYGQLALHNQASKREDTGQIQYHSAT